MYVTLRLRFVCHCDTCTTFSILSWANGTPTAAPQRTLVADRHGICWDGLCLNSKHHHQPLESESIRIGQPLVGFCWTTICWITICWMSTINSDWTSKSAMTIMAQWEMRRPPFLLVMRHSLSICCHGFLPAKTLQLWPSCSSDDARWCRFGHLTAFKVRCMGMHPSK